MAPMMADALEGTALVLSDMGDQGAALLNKVGWKNFMRAERGIFRSILLRKEFTGLPLPLMEKEVLKDFSGPTPEWRKAVEALEKARENDVLPALPPAEVPPMPKLPEEE